MKKRLTVLSLCIVMIMAAAALLGACGGTPATTTTETQAPAQNATEAPTATEAPSAAEEPPATKDVVELVWFMGDPGKIPADQAKVEAKLNEISIEKVNATMKGVYYNNEQVQLALNANEKWDMVFTCEWYNNFAVQAQAGFFADITPQLMGIASELYQTMPEMVWEGAKIDGKILAIPVKKDYAAEIFWRFDKALFVDALGMEIPEKMTFGDVEPYLAAAKEAWANGVEAAANAEYPYTCARAGIAADNGMDMINRDVYLGIPYSAVGTPDEFTVTLSIEVPEVVERMKLVRKWYVAGYINPDAPTLETAPGSYSAVKNGQGFYGADAIWSGADGFTQLISKFSGPYLSTASIRGSMNAINAKSANIDAAMLYQQLVNTDKEYRDILRYGVEGEHWNRTPEGLVQKTQTGRDAYGPWQFSQGSYSLSSVEAAEGVTVDPNMWQVIFDSYKDAVATKTIGFSFNIDNVQAQVAACNVIREKFVYGLATGAIDPEVELPKLIAELETAGIRDVQAECQRQLDAYLGR